MSEAIRYEPIAPPTRASGKDSPRELSKEQQDAVNTVLGNFSGENYEIPNVEEGKLLEEEKMWLSYECAQRFLRAVNWETSNAIKRLELTLKWRREWGIYSDLKDTSIAEDAQTGGAFVFGYEKGGAPIMHCLPSSIVTDDADRQTRMLVWNVERTIDLTAADVENISIFINYANQTRNFAWKAAYNIATEFQAHYPETLGRAVINNAPWYLNAFFKFILPFLDPVTREKLRFEVPVLEEGIVEPDMIMDEWYGGNQKFEYDHDKYYPALIKLCETRRNASKEKWKALGGKVGLKEVEFKAGGKVEGNGNITPGGDS